MKSEARWVLAEVASLALAGGAAWSAGCATSAAEGSGLFLPSDAGVASALGSSTAAPAGSCSECLSSDNCGSDVCAQFQGGTFCAPPCTAGEGVGACASGTTCSVTTSYNGDQASVCVPDGDTCGGAGIPPSGSSFGSGGGSTSVDSGRASPPSCMPASSNCDGYAAPTAPSTCDSCGGSSSACQPNGCYGGWYCDVTTSKCHAAPSGCGDSGGVTCPADAGGGSIPPVMGSGGATTPTTVSGTVKESGGTVSNLLFAVTGDTRPANEDDTAGYPTNVIEAIFSDIAARSPMPSFVVSTGDYQFASTSGTESAPQIDLYLAARAKYPGVQFPAMGNHECTGYTASNCGSGNTDGVTKNFTNFLQMMLGPIHQTAPYYVVNINASDASWTSKLVFVAANAWDSAQASWLSATLAVPTTYTFVMRHEANEANTAPGTTPSESIIKQYPLTLEICGHTHDYSHSGNRMVMGNGGAPLTGDKDYGYGVVAQRSDGAIVVDEIDYQTGTADSSFHFVVTPTGTMTQ